MEEVKRWIGKSKEDLETAKYNLKGNKIDAGLFFLQQSAEKALKALQLKKTNRIRKIHDLVILGKNVGLPSNLIEGVSELTSSYIYSRYPDINIEQGLNKKSEKFVKLVGEVLKWVEENL